MARLGRYFLVDQPLRFIQRSNNREPVFFAEDDYAHDRDWLAAGAADYGCAVHGYVLMTNPVHLLVTPQAADSLPRTMQPLGRRYVRHVNTIYRRTRTMGRALSRRTDRRRGILPRECSGLDAPKRRLHWKGLCGEKMRERCNGGATAASFPRLGRPLF
jgi:REP element-mobilizing transposase RayT